MQGPIDKSKVEGKGKSSTTEEVLALLNDFLVKQSRLSSSKALAFEERISDRAAKLSEADAKLGPLATSLYKIKNQYLLVYRVVETKFVHLVKLMTDALNKEDYLLLALCARSLIDHAAFMSYLVRQAKAEDVETLFNLYGKSFYSTRYFGQEGLVDTLNLLAMVEESLSIDSDRMNEFYDHLCDFLHPAFSSNVSIDHGEVPEGTIGPSAEQKRAAIDKLLQMVANAVRYLDHETGTFVSLGTTIEDQIKKSLAGTATRSFDAKKPERSKKWQPPPEETNPERGPLGGAVFFDKTGRIWHKY